MGKFKCSCGHVISDVQCPNDVTGWVLSDKSSEEFFNAISATVGDYLTHAENGDVESWRQKHFTDIYPNDVSAGDMIHDVLTGLFFSLTLAAMECDQCGRIWIQENPDLNRYLAYSPDGKPDSRSKILGHNSARLDKSGE